MYKNVTRDILTLKERGIVYTFKENITKEEYDSFIETVSMAPFCQEYNWSEIKDNWGNFHCGLYKDNKLIGVCLILIKKIKFLKLFYVLRGYLIDFTNYEDLKAMTKNIKKLAKKNKAYAVKIAPNFCISDNSFKDEEVEHNYSKDYYIKHENLKKLGYKCLGVQKDMHKSFQPQYNIFAPLCDSDSNILSKDEVIKNYSRIKSYFGNYQEKRGITFEITNDTSKIDILMDLLHQTEQKQSINLRNKEYFEKIMKYYKNEAYLVFANIDLNKYLNFLNETNAEGELKTDAKELLEKYGNTMTLSGALILLPQNTAGIRTSEYLYAGNNLNLTKLHASAALVFEIIKFSIENNCHYCNLGGVDGHLTDHLTSFKQRFNGRIMEFACEYDLIISWIYYPVKLLYPLALKIYKLLHKKKH